MGASDGVVSADPRLLATAKATESERAGEARERVKMHKLHLCADRRHKSECVCVPPPPPSAAAIFHRRCRCKLKHFIARIKKKGLFCGRRRYAGRPKFHFSLSLFRAPRKNNNSALFITGTAGKNEKFHRRRQISQSLQQIFNTPLRD